MGLEHRTDASYDEASDHDRAQKAAALYTRTAKDTSRRAYDAETFSEGVDDDTLFMQHQSAASAHRDAAGAQEATGNMVGAAKHLEAARHHDALASMNAPRTPAGKPYTVG